MGVIGRLMKLNRMAFIKKINLLLVGLVILVLSGTVLFLIKVDLSENLFIHHSEKTYSLNRELMVDQTFVGSRGGLRGVDLRFKKTNDSNHPVRLHLKRKTADFQEPIELFSGEFNASQIENDKFYRFYFPILNDSRNGKFTFSLAAGTSTESASVSPIISGIDIYLEGNAFINGKLQAGDVIFNPVYQVSLPRFLSYYLNKIAFAKPKTLGKVSLVVLVFCLGASFAALFFYLVYQAISFLKVKKEILKVVFLFVLFFVSLLILYYRPKVSFFLNQT